MIRGVTGADDQLLIGRDQERAILDGLARTGPSATPGIGVAFGPAGIGKSALLADVAARAVERRVIELRGTQAQQMTPYGILTQLIIAVGPGIPTELPAPQRSTLEMILEHGAVDDALVRLSIATLLDLVGPLLIVIDDLQDADPGSRAVLIAVAGRLARERLVLIVGIRGDSVPADIAARAVAVPLGPLTDVDANTMLDRLPDPPSGRRRFDILRCAAGNPLAIVELTRHHAPPRGLPGAGPVPLTEVLAVTYGADLAELPERTRWAVLLAASGEARLRILHAPSIGVAPDDWDAAEAVGLLSVVAGRVHFRHPLVESAVYFSEPEERRHRAHTVLVAALTNEPGLVAWHRSSCAAGPDESIAHDLADYAEQVVATGDSVTAALVLHRSAELSVDERAMAQRLLRAAELAGTSGQTSWVEELIAPIIASPALADLHPQAAALMGWLEMMSDRPAAAVDVLLGITVPGQDPNDSLLGTAALPVYALGTATAIDRLGRALDRARATGVDVTTPQLTWPSAVAQPSAEILARVRAVPTAATIDGLPELLRAANAGACCLVLDESRRSIDHLEPVCAQLSRGVTFHPAQTAFSALGWAYLDVARPTAAQANAVAATGAGTLPVIAAVATVQTAIASLMLGLDDESVAAARRTVESSADPAIGAQLQWALGRYAVSRGDLRSAWTHLRGLYDQVGAPVHAWVGLLAIGDACSVGARSGRHDEARRLLAATRAGRSWFTRRQELILGRAEAVLGDDSEAVLEMVAADPAGPEWPLEHGLALLDLGMIRHRARRAAAARQTLHAATSVFEHIGARRWEAVARERLRAAGERAAPPAGTGLDALTQQQRRIVRLAAQGLSNQEIGNRLFLSARTVGSHLYRSFPKLGISSRAQLSALIETTDSEDA